MGFSNFGAAPPECSLRIVTSNCLIVKSIFYVKQFFCYEIDKIMNMIHSSWCTWLYWKIKDAFYHKFYATCPRSGTCTTTDFVWFFFNSHHIFQYFHKGLAIPSSINQKTFPCDFTWPGMPSNSAEQIKFKFFALLKWLRD